MKICFLAGADSIHSYKWVKYFAENGHDVHWISLAPGNQGRVENASFYLVKGNLFQKAFRVRKLIRRINPDVLHAHYAGINGLFAALSGFHPFILTAWGSDILLAGKSMVKGPFVKYALGKADLITCDADHMKEAMIKLGTNPLKIKIIYFGVDAKRFSPGPKEESLLDKLKIKNQPVVISLRNMEPIYNIENFIEGAFLVLKKIPDVKFLIIGSGSEEKKLKELALSLGISESVNFTGRIQNNEMVSYLRISDVYVSTSLSDAGIASSTAEAMACGLPPVVTNTGENGKWIADGESGFLVPVKNPEKLAEKIIYLIKNNDQRSKIGAEARKTIEEKNNYYREMEKMGKIYEEIIKKS